MSVRVSIIWILLLLLAAGVMGGLRYRQAYTVIDPTRVAFSEIKNLTYDPTTGIFEVTAPDPFGYLELPAHSIPLRELRMEFAGAAQPGGWYVYPSPAHLRTLVLNQDWVVTAEAEATKTGHALVWTMEGSRIARIDFPDGLNTPMTLERIVLTTDYVSSFSPLFMGTILASAAAFLFFVATALRGHWRRPGAQLAFMITLIVIKVLLAQGLGQTFMMHLKHDDRLFMNQAQSIHAGEWLGEFDELTLAKGPTYSMFLALSAASGLPLQLNQLIFHSIACLVFIWAVSPWFRRAGWRIGLFTVLLFDPHSMSAELMGRVLRSGIHPALTLFMFAGLTGLVARARYLPKHLVGWATLTAVAGVCFWFSREEGVWAVPSVLLLLGVATLHGWQARERVERFRFLGTVWVLPAILFLGGQNLLRAVNHHHYGVWIGVDVMEGSFPAAYGALTRVTNPDPIPGVPTTRATRELIYEVSPTFAQLKSRIENEMLPKWRGAGWKRYPHARAGEEIRHGWFSWAIREAAHKAGVYADAPTAERFWQDVADEVNTAVEEGRLPGSSPRHGFFPIWDPSFNAPAVRAWFRAIDLVARSDDFKAHGGPSRGDKDEINKMAEFFHAKPVHEISSAAVDVKMRLMIYQVYAWMGWPLTALALVATGWLAVRSFRQVSARYALAALLAFWGGVVALALVVALIQASAFTALIGSYLGPAAPLMMVCWVLAPWLAWIHNPFNTSDS